MTDIELKEYVERIVEHERDMRKVQFEDSLRGLSLAKQEIDRKREWFDSMYERIENRMQLLEKFQNNLQGRLWAMGAVLLVLQLATAVVSMLLRK